MLETFDCRGEIAEGAESLRTRLQQFSPRIAAFNGKEIYRIFSGKKDFSFGLQPETLAPDSPVRIFVLPSSSARCTQLPRYTDKVPYYVGLAALRDHLKGLREAPPEDQIVFPGYLPPSSSSPVKGHMKTQQIINPTTQIMDGVKTEVLDSLLNTASAQGTPPHPIHDDANAQGSHNKTRKRRSAKNVKSPPNQTPCPVGVKSKAPAKKVSKAKDKKPKKLVFE